MSYVLPKKSPFSYNVGMCFHTNMTNWYSSNGSRQHQIQYSQDRLEKVVQTFKLIRIYGFLTAGWESTGDLDPCAQALVNVLKNNKELEAMISTTNSKDWFKTQNNVDSWVKKLKSELGSAVSQIKTILICNEINANGITASDINTIMGNFKNNADFMDLKIPLSVSFSNLPDQAGDTKSDALVEAVMNNWAPSWNGNYPFVFIDPYPDAKGIDNPAGVFNWQGRVHDYYAKKYPNIQIFIAETGAEGSKSDDSSEPLIEGILQQLDTQYSTNKRTVPTFMFEAINEPLKSGQPLQTHMGVYADKAGDQGAQINLKPHIKIPQWVGQR
ncbi:hypothetical protein [Xanthovirga aplysinae]|uniref:hypothetical protein n=1 Tax=Xanthovirga aplysinae TaxID=2529853 RepID=UPI0012BCA221|nr:hypothetical protein [Xanthovirga aplysinae]MTI31773.1 hypothetical protein [Xanthovirga aplysinae]